MKVSSPDVPLTMAVAFLARGFRRHISDEPLPFGGTHLVIFAYILCGKDIVLGITPAEDDFSVALYYTIAISFVGYDFTPVDSEVSFAIYTIS